jgi:hypothetical protein
VEDLHLKIDKLLTRQEKILKLLEKNNPAP